MSIVRRKPNDGYSSNTSRIYSRPTLLDDIVTPLPANCHPLHENYRLASQPLVVVVYHATPEPGSNLIFMARIHIF